MFHIKIISFNFRCMKNKIRFLFSIIIRDSSGNLSTYSVLSLSFNQAYNYAKSIVRRHRLVSGRDFFIVQIKNTDLFG